ncbi:conjugal transfer protein TraH [Allochromatium humboldtianum]|uniref:Conjugal transfer protein TraH n=1 Tax=Allochromatium humboldtianum TaxID=504901 RepID=A0A850RK70_9GAMM|nr:conjugal transfer protein TraH [Allochromatium humboldtianum]NVZ11502.1 conjugal transfer protein TraH [Allochromatium humboldtianum]
MRRPISRAPQLFVMGLSVILVLLSSPTQAGLKEAMNEMFVGTSTNAQAIETQRLHGIYGGSMTLRPMGRGINIVQFAAPRIDAGCGGIDIFFGSFSFINGEQFEQLLRSLASAAVGYAIKAAIQAMCDPCAAILSELEAAIRELNALAKNTCAIANAMFSDNGFEKLAERARKIGTHLASAANKTADWVAGENKSQSKTVSEDVKENVAEENPVVGNLVYRAAKETLNNGANTLKAFLSEQEAIELVMGLYGTVIVLPDADSNEASTNTCPSGVSAERCDKPAEYLGASIPTWDVLFYPRRHVKDGVPVWKCGGENCTRPITGNIPLGTWGGVEDAVNLAMFGVAEPTGVADYTADSIVGSILNGGEGGLSTRARQLLAVMPMPIYRQLLEIQKSPGAVAMIGEQVAKFLPDFFAYQMGVEFVNIGKNVFTKQTKATPPPAFEAELKEKSAALIAIRPNWEKMMDSFNHTTQAVINVQRLTVSPFSTGSN